MISLDTETTGRDLYHGCRPFFVTICEESGNQRWWEWDVDPLTREVQTSKDDLIDIAELLINDLVLQNPRFDAAALAVLDPQLFSNFPWHRTNDTLMAGHLLASNKPHDLTSMAMQYLHVNIEPLEKDLGNITKAAQRLARSKFPEWLIANPEILPSVKNTSGNKPEAKKWKNDTWLPRAFAKELDFPKPAEDCPSLYREKNKFNQHNWDVDYLCKVCGGHRWWVALREYANTDSGVTLALWPIMWAEIERRKLVVIYKQRMKLLPIIAGMEARGITINRPRLDSLKKRYVKESYEAGEICRNIARSYQWTNPDTGLQEPYELDMPEGGVNNSLRTFCFDILKLEHRYNPKAKSDAPTLNKEALGHYLVTLPTKSKGLTFLQKLLEKRGRDTAIGFLEGYERFWVEMKGIPDWFLLHPSLNPTGTDTLRCSSSNPNSQNIKKGEEGESIRFCFGPAPGREWYSLDAKNIELRIPFYKCGQEELIALFERPNDPPYYGSQHLLNFSIVYEDLWNRELKEVGLEKVGPHCKKKYADSWYQWCKNGDFAIQYQAGDATADRAFHMPGARAKLKAKFAKLDQLNQWCMKFAERHGYVETIPDKTVDPHRGYPLLCTRTEEGRVKPTIPLSYYVQGSAMQWTLKGMVRVHEFFEQLNDGAEFEGKTWPGGYYIAMQVHDELVVDAPSGKGKGEKPWDYNAPVINHVKRLMEQGGDDIGIPTPVGLEFHEENWSIGVTLA